MALDVLLDLRVALLRFVEQQQVLLRLDRAVELVAARVELGAPDVVPGVQERHIVLRDLHGGFRVRLRHLLLGLIEIEARLLERERLLGGVELDDDVARLDGVARRASFTICRLPPTGGARSWAERPARSSPVV